MKTHTIHFSTIDSTNSYAKRNKGRLDKNTVTIIYADTQTAGRARFDHQWLSPSEGNLYVTFCFHLTERLRECAQFSLAAAVTVAGILEKYEISPTLKWPNDIQIEGKKIGGVLLETSPTEEGLFLFCGLGLNINMSEKTLDFIGIPATSLLLETKKSQEVKDVLHRLTDKLLLAIKDFRQQGISPFLERYRQLTAFWSRKKVSFRNAQGKRLEGIFVEITNEGALVLKLEDGETVVCYSGEIE